MKRFNQQILRTVNLRPGTYALRIDDQRVGAWSAKELAAGVNLAEHPTTPQYQQALAVKAVNDERLAVVDKLRAFGCERFLITERGSSFGYHNLVVDFRFPRLAESGTTW